MANIQEQAEVVFRIAGGQVYNQGKLEEIREMMNAHMEELLMTLGEALFSPFGAMYENIEAHRTELNAMFHLLERALETEGQRILRSGQ